MQKILTITSWIQNNLTEDQCTFLRSMVEPHYEIVPFDDLEKSRYEEVEIALGPLARADAATLKNLRWLQLTYAGVEGFLSSSGALRADFQLTNATGAFGEPIAEHVLAMFLCLQQNLHLYRDQQNARAWVEQPHIRGFAGSTVAVIGLGDIGLATAEKCKSLGARVLAVKRTPCEIPDCVDSLYFDLDESLDRVLAEADYIALCLPHTSATKHIIDARRLALLKDHAVLVNIGRGALIDQDALIAELKTGRIAAGLDVMTPEPLNEDSALWGLHNCLITPHVSGRSEYNMPVILRIFADNYKRFLAGEELYNLVDFEAGY